MLKTRHPTPAPRTAFTLIELLVVMTIVVVLIAVSAPVIKTLSKSNGTASAANLVRSYLANARAVAITQHHYVGVVFFEETPGSAGTLAHGNQTAMQIFWDEPDQDPSGKQFTYNGTSGISKGVGNTIFVAYSNDRQYLPTGTQLATLNDSSTTTLLTGQNTSGTTCRAVLFDPSGQLVLRNGLARLALTGAAGQYPQMYRDWNFTTPAGSASVGVSSPGVLIYDKASYDAESNSGAFATDQQRSQWLQSNATIIVINPYTGGVIQ